MALFQPIAPASYPKGTAQEAALLKAKYDAEAKARSDSLRSNNIKGASDIYNKSMGDRTPINDWLTKQFGGAPPSNLPGQTTAGKSGFTSGSGVGGNVVPELPPYAMQMMVLMFGGGLGYLKRRKK